MASFTWRATRLRRRTDLRDWSYRRSIIDCQRRQRAGVSPHRLDDRGVSLRQRGRARPTRHACTNTATQLRKDHIACARSTDRQPSEMYDLSRHILHRLATQQASYDVADRNAQSVHDHRQRTRITDERLQHRRHPCQRGENSLWLQGRQ